MKTFITKNFLNLLLLTVIVFILLRDGCNSKQPLQKKPDTVIVIDTTYITKTKTIIKKMRIASKDTSYDFTKEPKFIPDTSYETLKEQFLKLSKDYTTRNIYKDTLALDSIGFVYVNDSVQFNTLSKRNYTYSYKLPIVTKTTTITNYAKPVRQFYAGLGINSLGVNSINAGLMYKSRRDQLYGFTLGVNNNSLVYGFQTYIKIKLKK
jgi:hypothetical protein